MAVASSSFAVPTNIDLVDIGLIDSNPEQDTLFGKGREDVTELAESIRSRGLLQPVVLTPANGRFRVVAGHRRIAALRLLKVAKVPATIRKSEQDVDHVIDMLVENIQREDITAMQKAKAFARLAELGVKQREIAKQVGVTQPVVSRYASLVELPEEVQEAVDAGGINFHDALDLLELKDNPEALLRVFNNRGKGNLKFLIGQVRQAETKRREKAEAPPPSEDDLKLQKDAASKRRLLTKLVKQADEIRGKAIKGTLKGRLVKSRMLDWTINRLVEMAPKEAFEMACAALDIPKINSPTGFGQMYDLDAFYAANEEENRLKLAFAVSLVRGHGPLLSAKTPLTGNDRMFAESTLDYLAEFATYYPNQAEQVLIGRLDVGKIAPPPKEDKPKKETAKAKAKKGKSKDPNAALEHQTDERDDSKTEITDVPAGVGEPEQGIPIADLGSTEELVDGEPVTGEVVDDDEDDE